MRRMWTPVCCRFEHDALFKRILSLLERMRLLRALLTPALVRVCVCVYVYVCARERVRACVCRV